MYSTYKCLRSCTNSYYLDKNLEELCSLFKKSEDAREKNKIFSAMFCNMFPMINKIQAKYYSLTNEQKVDHALWHLLRSIRYYKDNGKVKFSSFFYTHLSNQMKTLLSTQSNNKNAVFNNIVKDNEGALRRYETETPDKILEHSEWYFRNSIQNASNLSSEEKALCECVINGYVKTKDIASQMRRITNPMNKIIDEKAELRKIRKIKQSIKDKANAFKQLKLSGTEIFN